MIPLDESLRDICNICTIADLDNPLKQILKIVEDSLSECNSTLNVTFGIEQKVNDAWLNNPLYIDMINEIHFAQRRIQCSMDPLKYLRVVLLDALSERKISSDSSR